MAIAIDATTHSTGKTWSHTCTGSNLILFVGWTGNVTTDLVTGITYNGAAMTPIDKVLTPGDRYVYLYCLVNPDVGTHDVIVTEPTGDYVGGYSTSYTGAKQTGQPDSSNKGTVNPASSITVATTVVASNCWLAGVVNAVNSSYTLSAGTGAYGRNFADKYDGFVDSNGVVSTGSQSMQVLTTNSEAMAMIIASFSPNLTTTSGNMLLLF